MKKTIDKLKQLADQLEIIADKIEGGDIQTYDILPALGSIQTSLDVTIEKIRIELMG